MKPEMHFTQLIKGHAQQLGFDYCGISKADFLEEEAPRLEQWLLEGRHGRMKYMENYFDKRLDPRKLVDGAKSVISLLYNYYPNQSSVGSLHSSVSTERTSVQTEDWRLETGDSSLPKISKYAYGRDYHHVLKEKMKALMEYIYEEIGEVNGRAFVDSAPVLDKAWAKRSGLGWIGKNTNLINKQSGSFFFIAEIIVDLELEYDSAIEDYCGTCTACIDACPTEAIIEPYVVDGSKCISYFTIELKDAIPQEMKGKMDGWAFGCDICQDVCPWNRFSKPHREPQFEPKPELQNMTNSDWLEMTEEVFTKLFQDSAIKRTGYKGLKRNLEFLKS